VHLSTLNQGSEFKPEDFAILQGIFKMLQGIIMKIQIDPSKRELTRNGKAILEMLQQMNINFETFEKILKIIDAAADLIMRSTSPYHPNSNIKNPKRLITYIYIPFKLHLKSSLRTDTTK
jgi:hypothetical protein